MLLIVVAYYQFEIKLISNNSYVLETCLGGCH